MLSLVIGSYSVGFRPREHFANCSRLNQRWDYVMSLLFANSENLDKATPDLLTRAYEAACDELAADYYLTSSQLAGLIDEMASAIRDLYGTGQRGQGKLTRHAVNCALRSIEHRNAH
jgi:hypothetical protein